MNIRKIPLKSHPSLYEPEEEDRLEDSLVSTNLAKIRQFVLGDRALHDLVIIHPSHPVYTELNVNLDRPSRRLFLLSDHTRNTKRPTYFA